MTEFKSQIYQVVILGMLLSLKVVKKPVSGFFKLIN